VNRLQKHIIHTHIHTYIHTLRLFLSTYTTLQKQLLSLSYLSVHLSAWKNLTPSGQLFMKFVFAILTKICYTNSSRLKFLPK